MYKHSMVLIKRLLTLSSSRVIGLLKVVRQVGRFGQFTKFRVTCCSCSAPCSCLLLLLCSLLLLFAIMIVRSASNLSTVPWFHSVCASVSMITINTDNCLCLFLFLFLFPFRFLFLFLCLPRVSVHISRPLCAHTKSAEWEPDPSSACHHHLVVECGIHGL